MFTIFAFVLVRLTLTPMNGVTALPKKYYSDNLGAKLPYVQSMSKTRTKNLKVLILRKKHFVV